MCQRKRTLFFTQTAFVFVAMILVGKTAWGGGIKLQVSAEQANIREKPDIMSLILQQLPQGAILEADRKEGEWYAVPVEKEGGGTILGFVHESLVMVIEEAPPSPAPQKERDEEQKPAPRRPVEIKPEEPRLLSPQTQATAAETRKGERMAVVLWLGGRRAAVGDLNDGAEGLARYYESRLSAAGEGEVQELHFGYLFGAEVRIPLMPGVFVSLGAEHSSGEASGSVTYKGTDSVVTYSTKPSLRTTPVNLALVFYPQRFFYVRAGLDYTFARCAYFYRLSYPDPGEQTEFWQEWTGKASSSGFGFELGLGLEYTLGSFLSVIAEGAYRHGRLNSLDGDDFYQESTGYQSRERGPLYRFEASAGGKETYPLVFVREKEPTEAGVMDVRRAEIDLSGYSLKIGLKVRF